MTVASDSKLMKHNLPMYQNNIFQEDSSNDNEISVEGLTSALLDGLITNFSHKGLRVRKDSDKVTVHHPVTGQLGSPMVVNSHNVTQVVEWIENKVKIYGDNR